MTEEKKSGGTLVKVISGVFAAVVAPVAVAVLVKYLDPNRVKDGGPPPSQAASPSGGTPLGGTPSGRTLDEQKLQGRWKCVKQSSEGWTIEWAEVNAPHFKLTGRVEKKASGTANGQFHLNPQANPKEFDWEGTGHKGNHHKWVGIYALDGNRFRLCFRSDMHTKAKPIPRPAWSEAQAADVAYLEFEKVN